MVAFAALLRVVKSTLGEFIEDFLCKTSSLISGGPKKSPTQGQ